MSKQANMKLIGVFVVAAISLLIYALVVLTSGRLFNVKYTYALYFDESVRGLNEGSGVAKEEEYQP